jgi:hypothetical protein
VEREMPKKGYIWTADHHKHQSEAHFGKKLSDYHRGRQAESRRGKKRKPFSYNHLRNLSKSHRGKHQSEEERRKKSNALAGRPKSYIHRMKIHEYQIGGFWYGNVRYRDPPKYCELWNSDLWHRIDEAQNYQSILSGKTKEDNGGRALSRHHVYWQKKACCGWDEDIQGYYAMINLGNSKIPDWHKHYIIGDPNKFVLLTAREHRTVANDKLKWIGIFEELIETKLGGVCYLPKGVE